MAIKTQKLSISEVKENIKKRLVNEVSSMSDDKLLRLGSDRKFFIQWIGTMGAQVAIELTNLKREETPQNDTHP